MMNETNYRMFFFSSSSIDLKKKKKEPVGIFWRDLTLILSSFFVALTRSTIDLVRFVKSVLFLAGSTVKSAFGKQNPHYRPNGCGYNDIVFFFLRVFSVLYIPYNQRVPIFGIKNYEEIELK